MVTLNLKWIWNWRGCWICHIMNILERQAIEVSDKITNSVEVLDAYVGPGYSLPTTAMVEAIKMANISTNEINYINAHGTSTPMNDFAETRAIKKSFGKYAYSVPVSSTKSMLGHCLGGAGAIEAAVSVLSILNNEIHSTINYEEPDPECDLDYVVEGPRKKTINTVLSNSFGFGGQNAFVILQKI